MKGWIYVISNKAMPELLKVGYSMKDPELRARELDHSGSPHPYVVEYDMLIENPQPLEQKVHHILSQYREGKEWFRCTPEVAINAIKFIAEDRAIIESFKKADREKVERLSVEKEEEEKMASDTSAAEQIHSEFEQNRKAEGKVIDEEYKRRRKALGLIDKGKACEASGQYREALYYYKEAEKRSSDNSATLLISELKKKMLEEEKRKGGKVI